ncbi:MAG: hypothetical protein HFJ19_01755 [Clostridia bacterium]|nr:hypothetical protein [Clostridia bacterium]
MLKMYKKASPKILAVILFLLANFYIAFPELVFTNRMSYGVFLNAMNSGIIYSVELDEDSDYMIVRLRGIRVDDKNSLKRKYTVILGSQNADILRDAEDRGVKIVKRNNDFYDPVRLIHVWIIVLVVLAINRVVQWKRRTPSEEVQDTIMSEEEKRVIATHISGHIVVSLFMSTQPRIEEVSIIPHNINKRLAWNDTTDDKKYSSKTELMEELAVLMAGRAAEREIIGDISTRASKDIEFATKIATKMVIVYGMDSKFGPISIKCLKEYDLLSEKILSDIYDRISQIIKEAEERSSKLIHVHRELVEKLIQVLIEKETVTGEEIQQIYNEYN